jgi:hypothetical protein
MHALHEVSLARESQGAPTDSGSAQRATVSNVFEKRHMGEVAQLPCVVCALRLGFDAPAEVHHIEHGKSDFLTVPLCSEHHRGASGLHGLSPRGFNTRWKLSELDLLAFTLEMLARVRAGQRPIAETVH